ncbi:MAG TPA: membrane protein insertase YidC, partial [Chthoniobacterales bacterium]|nr:membrane protein insertase YidC [Chthoniobacterales bacterium]
MDRTAWIAVVLCTLGLIGWYVYVGKQSQQLRHQPLAVAASPTPPASVGPTSATPPPAPAPSATATPVPSATPQFAEKTETLRNDDVELHLTNRGGGIAEAVLVNHVASKDDPRQIVLNSKEQMPIGAILDQPTVAHLDEFNLSREPDGGIKCERVGDGVTVRKRFFFPASKEKKDNFVTEMDVEIVNGGAAAYSNPGYFVSLGSAAPIHPKDYAYYTRLVWCLDGKAKGVDVNYFGESHGFLGIGGRAAQPFYQQEFTNADWAAVSDQFFTTLIAPLSAKGNGVAGHRFDISPNMFGITGALRMPGFQLPPGQTYSARFEIWAGPKIYHSLARLEHNEAEIMDFGIFKIVSQFLLNFLNWLHGFLGSYGWSILALTAVVKIVLWPLQDKANKSMRRMSLLNPKVQELRDKYKDDPTKMNQEVMKLYKDYGINPVGGCLPMLIQIPIFFGLFKMLGQAVELRNAHFLWVSDLSQPDTVAHLFGIPINVIPLCMAASQIWL